MSDEGQGNPASGNDAQSVTAGPARSQPNLRPHLGESWNCPTSRQRVRLRSSPSPSCLIARPSQLIRRAHARETCCEFRLYALQVLWRTLAISTMTKNTSGNANHSIDAQSSSFRVVRVSQWQSGDDGPSLATTISEAVTLRRVAFRSDVGVWTLIVALPAWSLRLQADLQKCVPVPACPRSDQSALTTVTQRLAQKGKPSPHAQAKLHAARNEHVVVLRVSLTTE